MKKKCVATNIISVGMVLVIGTSLVAGCGLREVSNNTTASNTVEEQTEEQGTSDEITTFTFYSADGNFDIPWTDPVAKKITEATGVKLDYSYPSGDSDEKIALMITSGDYPDIIFAKGGNSNLISAGALIDLTDLIEEYGPHIKALYGDYYSHLKYSTEDPSIYSLCSSAVWGNRYTTSGSCQLQYAVLEANDYKIPKTLEEYEAYIKAYMAENPTIDGQETIGISISCSDWHWYITLANPAGFIADASPDNGQWIIDDNNNYQATYKCCTENEKVYFKWLNRMYNEGVLDPDFATQTHDDYIAKISSGRVLGILDRDWDYEDAQKELVAENKSERTYAPLPVTLYEDQTCPELMQQGPTFGWGIAITTACEDPVKAIQFIDYLCSDEGQVLTHWGIEGVNYFIDEDGHRYRTEEEIAESQTDVDYDKETGVGLHTYPWPTYGDGYEDSTGSTYTTNSKDTVIADYNEAEKKCCEALGISLLTDYFPQADEFSTPSYSPVWAQTLPQDFISIQSELDDVAWSGLIKAIICPEDEFEEAWENLQQELIEKGRYEAEAMLTEILQEQAALYGN